MRQAFVALKPGTSVSPQALLGHCRAQLATYKVPVSILILDELPKGPTGKILRRGLRAPSVP